MKLDNHMAEQETENAALWAELKASRKQIVLLREQLQELQRQQATDGHHHSDASSTDGQARLPAWILLPMRLFLGLTFIYAGIQKLTDPQFFDPSTPGYIGNQINAFAHGSPLHDFLIGFALPHAVLFGVATALGEIAIGLGTYAGLLFRPAAFFGMILSLTFFLSASWNVYPYFFGSDIVFVFCWITMLLGGPLNTGLPSIDDWIMEQLVPGGDTRQKSLLVRWLYSFLVGNGIPKKSSQTSEHSLNATQIAQRERRRFLQEWVIGAAEIAGITLLGFPLRIFSTNTDTNVAETSPISSSGSPADSTSTPPVTPVPVSTAGSISAGHSIVQASSVPKNAYVTFTIASSQDPGILIHLPNGQFVAYDATCTHSGCPVAYNANTHALECPCHGSKFDPVRQGAVINGPAATPLAGVSISIDSATGAIMLQ